MIKITVVQYGKCVTKVYSKKGFHLISSGFLPNKLTPINITSEAIRDGMAM